MQLIWTALIGVAAGGVAALTLPGRRARGFLATAGLGALGALAASVLGQFAGLYAIGETAGFVGATLGAAALLTVHHVAMRD